MIKIDWYKEYSIESGLDTVELVGKYNKNTAYTTLVNELRHKLRVTIHLVQENGRTFFNFNKRS
jgi:hypothetical protein